MTKKIISILIPLLVSCSTLKLNQYAHSSLKEVCIDLLSVRVTIDIIHPMAIIKTNDYVQTIFNY